MCKYHAEPEAEEGDKVQVQTNSTFLQDWLTGFLFRSNLLSLTNVCIDFYQKIYTKSQYVIHPNY